MPDDISNLNEEQKLKAENEFLKMKLMLERGASFGTDNDTALPAGVENEFLAAGFDERAWPESIHSRRRRARAQQRDPKQPAGRLRRRRLDIPRHCFHLPASTDFINPL